MQIYLIPVALLHRLKSKIVMMRESIPQQLNRPFKSLQLRISVTDDCFHLREANIIYHHPQTAQVNWAAQQGEVKKIKIVKLWLKPFRVVQAGANLIYLVFQI